MLSRACTSFIYIYIIFPRYSLLGSLGYYCSVQSVLLQLLVRKSSDENMAEWKGLAHTVLFSEQTRLNELKSNAFHDFFTTPSRIIDANRCQAELRKMLWRPRSVSSVELWSFTTFTWLVSLPAECYNK